MGYSKLVHEIKRSPVGAYQLVYLSSDYRYNSSENVYAAMVELVDTLASGASGGNPVEVRVLFAVPGM